MGLPDQFFVFYADRLRSIEHHQDQISVGESFHGLLNSNALGFVEGAANPGGVHELDWNSAKRNRFSHRVTGGPGSGGHDGALALNQPIEQTRFPDIRTTNDGESQSFMNDFSVSKRLSEFVERIANRRNVLKNLICGEYRNVVFGEVDSGFEQGNQLNQLLLDWLQAARECAFKLLSGNFGLIKGLRLDQIADSLGLREIDAAIQECSHGEFTGLREACSTAEGKFDDVTEHHR